MTLTDHTLMTVKRQLLEEVRDFLSGRLRHAPRGAYNQSLADRLTQVLDVGDWPPETNVDEEEI